jgi:hypothetical protein
MALQIRRGTASELSTFTPAEGELIFDKTNKKVYIGDGQTLGGLDVSIAGGIGGPLSSGINLNTFSITGNGDINITGSIAVSDTIIAANIQGSLQGNVIGDLVGDVYGNVVGGSVLGNDSSVLVDSITNKLTGDLSGNIVGINNNIVLDNTLQTPVFYGTVSGDIVGDVFGNVTGNVTGFVVGDVVGSVYSNDSTLMIDAQTNTISNGTMSINETVIRCSGSIDLRSDTLTGTAVAVTVNSSKTVGGSIISGGLGIQRFDIVTFGTDKENPGILESGEIFGALGFVGVQPNGSESVTTIGVQADPAATTTSTYIPSKLFIALQPDTQTKANAGQFPFLTFDSFGRLAVNQENAQATCDINGVMRLAPQSAVPSTVVEGMIAIADRVNWDPVNVGTGGSYPAYFDGTTWVKMI